MVSAPSGGDRSLRSFLLQKLSVVSVTFLLFLFSPLSLSFSAAAAVPEPVKAEAPEEATDPVTSLAGAMTSSASTDEINSEKYRKLTRPGREKRYRKLLQITSGADSVRFEVYDSSTSKIIVTRTTALLSLSDSSLLADNGILFAPEEVIVGQAIVNLGKVHLVSDSIYPHPRVPGENVTTISLWQRRNPRPATKTPYLRGILATGAIHSPAESFVRGSILSFGGDITIDGEVNHSVISLGGNISIGAGAVVRDHVVSLGGKVSVEDGSTVYGYLIPTVGGHSPARRIRPWTRQSHNLSPVPAFSYNRVDGLTPFIGWKFSDADSALPEIKLNLGVAIASERQRISFTIRQPLVNKGRLSAEASLYKVLKNNDDGLLPQWQNTILSLIGTADYQNYYESEGGRLGLIYSASATTHLRLFFTSEKLKSLPATLELWSLFGGDKDFPENYQGFSAAERVLSNAGFEGKRNVALELAFDVSNKKRTRDPHTEWSAFAHLEKSVAGWKSDFSFTRYSLGYSLRHRLSDVMTVNNRLRYNGSTGSLPLFRSFFLGGYRWLRGYDHYEYYGDENLALALDYGLNLDELGAEFLTLWLYYDAGFSSQAGVSSSLLQSVGLGLSLNGLLRLNLARQLDRSDPQYRWTVEF